MLIQALCKLLIGEAAKSIYTKKVSESLLRPWKNYTQSSQDLQKALQNAFRQSSAAIALALTPDGGASAYFKPVMQKEFAAEMRERYVLPFCGNDRRLERRLQQIGHEQCRRMAEALAEYPVQDIPSEEIAIVLYNVRFLTSTTVQHHTRLAKSSLHSALARQGLTLISCVWCSLPTPVAACFTIAFCSSLTKRSNPISASATC